MLWRLARPVLFGLPAEWTHYRAMEALQIALRLPLVGSLLERRFRCDAAGLGTTAMGLRFPHSIGLAAGFDKAGRWFNDLAQLGFGHVEIGTITALPQDGNPRPRLFRLPADKALLNRMGFNNPGAKAVAQRLARTPKNTVLGINIGKSKLVDNSDAVADYAESFRSLFPYADYFAVNVSSPNTPGLRQLQDRKPLAALLAHLQNLNAQLARDARIARRPIALKIAPDLNESQLDAIVEIIGQANIDGVIATNTTIQREGLRTAPNRLAKLGPGGISGAPLAARSRQIVDWLRRRLPTSVAIIGSGGIMTASDLGAMLDAGANLVQLYTGFVYGGPGVVKQFTGALAKRFRSPS